MKSLFFTLSLIFITVIHSFAQTPRSVQGSVIDSTKVTLPGSVVRITSEVQSDSTATATDANGKFNFPSIKGNKITITVTSLGYTGVRKHFSIEPGKAIVLNPIILAVESNVLNQVTVTAKTPVTFKEDTVEYNASAYKVRENAPIEDVIKKLPGVDVDANGNVTAQGKQVTKVRVNGKDFFGGDVQTATKNLPADVVESIQMIDDYGDQANITGVKTGEPDKIMNITIRKDKNYGYFGQATAGDGSDDIPKNTGTNDNRYLASVKAFDFDGDRQISFLGVLNNTNANLFNFGSSGSNPFGGGGFGGGGGGRGNALRGGGPASSGLATTANGITNTRSIGTNYNDQWGKHISAYGSYSFTDNTVFTNSTTLQKNNLAIPSVSNQASQQHDNPINHRANFSLEWKPDTINYLKVTPTYSYGSTNTTDFEDVTYAQGGQPNLAYNINSIDNSSSPSYGITALYNHKFKSHGRNFSLNLTANSAKSTAFDNPAYDYSTLSTLSVPSFQVINTDSRTTTLGATASYMEPVGKLSFLELNYAYSHSYTTADKETDTADYVGNLFNYPLLSNNYNYTFVTNRVGLNFRYIAKKYNYTLGLGVEPATLDGESLTKDTYTHNTTFNFSPTAHFAYNFSRSHSLNINFSSSSSQPSFSQLQPVIDYSNAIYPVEGNPNLKPSFNNNFSIRFNNFSFETGNVLFLNAQFTQTNNQIVANTITYPRKFASSVALTPDLEKLQNTNLTTYLNANGYYSASGFVSFAKPWEQRKYTIMLNGVVSYTNNIGYSSSVDSLLNMSPTEKNISKSLVFTPSTRFRIDLENIIDAQASASYSLAKTTNSQKDSVFNTNTNIRALTLAVTGKNFFFKDWTLGYDYSKVFNYGYNIKVTNPNILSLYVERRFLKDYAATIRLSAFDIFNQNTGFSTNTNGSIVTQTNVNRLGRYYLATFTYNLKKFAGKAPSADPGRNFRRGEGGGPGPGGPGPGGPPGGGPGF